MNVLVLPFLSTKVPVHLGLFFSLAVVSSLDFLSRAGLQNPGFFAVSEDGHYEPIK